MAGTVVVARWTARGPLAGATQGSSSPRGPGRSWRPPCRRLASRRTSTASNPFRWDSTGWTRRSPQQVLPHHRLESAQQVFETGRVAQVVGPESSDDLAITPSFVGGVRWRRASSRQGRRCGGGTRGRILWAWLSKVWSGWQRVLVFVQPATVVRWRRRKFRERWARLSCRSKPGRPPAPNEVREPIRRMSSANATWGSPVSSASSPGSASPSPSPQSISTRCVAGSRRGR